MASLGSISEVINGAVGLFMGFSVGPTLINGVLTGPMPLME